MGEGSLEKIATDTHYFIRLSYGGLSKTQLPVSDNDFVLFLEVTIGNLNTLLEYNTNYIDAVTESLGEKSSGVGLEEIFK